MRLGSSAISGADVNISRLPHPRRWYPPPPPPHPHRTHLTAACLPVTACLCGHSGRLMAHKGFLLHNKHEGQCERTQTCVAAVAQAPLHTRLTCSRQAGKQSWEQAEVTRCSWETDVRKVKVNGDWARKSGKGAGNVHKRLQKRGGGRGRGISALGAHTPP